VTSPFDRVTTVCNLCSVLAFESDVYHSQVRSTISVVSNGESLISAARGPSLTGSDFIS
jgi:hypothetical protein